MAKIAQSPAEYLTSLLEKNGLNPFRVSKDIQLSQSAVRLLVIGKTRISVPVALRLAKFFNTKPEMWLTMQMNWDMSEAAKDKELADVVKNIPVFKKDPLAVKKAAKKTAGAKSPASKTPKKPRAKAK